MKFNLQWLSFKCKIIENRLAISFGKYFKIFVIFPIFAGIMETKSNKYL